MAADRLACWMDFRQRRFQLAGGSGNCRAPLAGKESACWNCAAGRSRIHLDDHAGLAEI